MLVASQKVRFVLGAVNRLSALLIAGAFALHLAIPLACAQDSYPEDGWWWDPEASGRGYMIERQQDIMFVGAFVYADDGSPEWLTAVGKYTPSGATDDMIGSYYGKVRHSSGGQCIGCDYIAPVTVKSIQSPVTISFTDNQNATLEWFGESIPITRHLWSWYDAVDQLSGTWLFTQIEGDYKLSQTVSIADAGNSKVAEITSLADETLLGTIELLDENLVLLLTDSQIELPLTQPETKRFYAGFADADEMQVVALRLDDLPLVNVDGGSTDANFVATDWTEETHSKNVDPNHAEVFDDSQVKRLDFVITPERWQSMLDDMTATYGEFGQQTSPGLIDAEDPIFVPAEVFYNGRQWYRVGIRFKGNSSLQSSWSQGILKLSFKLDFDEYEDDYPQIDNQRFYGFKKFSLKNNFDDESFLREKVASDVFSDAGVEVSHTAFYTLYIDHGDGPEYFGLYTLVEEVDGEVLDTQFTSDDGNLYKPEGYGASFIENSFDEEYFEKKTNEDEEDWSDILALFSALHDDSYFGDPTAWRTGLESVFDVDAFLKYLAVNQVIQNWDSYGKMTQNYYLYNNPENSLLHWIPWDHNEALQVGKNGGALNLDFSDIQTDAWPLIEKLYADDTYRATYNDYVSQVINGPFETSAIQAKYDYYSAMVQPYAEAERSGYSFLESTGDFTWAIADLKTHAASRAAAVTAYLNSQ